MCTTTKTDTDNGMVDLLDLAAAAVSATIVAADQIRALACEPMNEGDAEVVDDDGSEGVVDKFSLNIRHKEDGSLVTDADLCAQQIIVQGLHKVSTRVRLVGEEAEDDTKTPTITGHEEEAERIYRLAKEEIDLRYHHGEASSHDTCRLPLSSNNEASMTTFPSKEVMRSSPLEEHTVEESRVSVFIDPLDGTKAYAKGDFPPVSILIAIILDNVPCFGVICKPFGYPQQPTVLDTKCVVIYGGTLLGAAYAAGGGFCTQSTQSIIDTATGEVETSIKALPRAVISSSRSGGIVEEFVNHLGSIGMIHPTPLHISGAGEKSLRILLRSENEGLWFFPKCGTSLWDVAASDALLRATGGRLTDKNGKDMDYNKTRLEAENLDGVVACYDHSLHSTCIKLFLEGSWIE